MNKFLFNIAGLLAGTTLILAAVPAAAADIDVRVFVPGAVIQPQPVHVQPRPVYVLQQHEVDWRARQTRAIEWRDNPKNHGQSVSAAAHVRNDVRKGHKQGNKHGNK